MAERYRPGDPIPEVCYTADEDALWALLLRTLVDLHREFACAEVVTASHALALPGTAFLSCGR